MFAVRRGAPAALVSATVAVAVFYIAYDGGSFSLAARSTEAIVVWWAIAVAVAAGLRPVCRMPPGAVATGALLALFAVWELVSIAWAPSAENALNEFDRTSLYLGVFVLACGLAGRGALRRSVDGIVVAIVAIGVVALVSRLVPGSFPGRGLATALPSSSTRLSFPLGYWNGLGAFVAIGVPLLLFEGLAGGRVRRVAATAALPLCGAVLYLTSSRGAALAAVAGAVVFIVAQPRRWHASAFALAGAIGSALCVAVLAPRHALVDGPLSSASAHAQGRTAAALILLACAVTVCAVEIAVRLAVERPRLARGPGRRWALLPIATVLAGIAYESGSLRRFTRVPDVTARATTTGHLLSGTGSGRWQFWLAALHEFTRWPITGGGAGTFADWWAQHASFPYHVLDAHSLFFQTLGELGIVGLLLLGGGLATGAVAGVRRLSQPGADGAAIAAVLGAFAAYVITAAVDWMWELTAVTVVGIAALGLASGCCTSVLRRPIRHWRFAAAIAALAVALVVAEAIPLLEGVEVAASRADASAGRLVAAREHALAATKIEPWAASGYLQLALVEESLGNLSAARTAAHASIRRDRWDWQPWYVTAEIDAAAHDTEAARNARARARELDPRSPLFS